jgi:hypothetical protein
MEEAGMRVPLKSGVKITLRTTADLHLRGWEEADVLISPTDSRHLKIREEGNLLNIFANNEVWVSVPLAVDVRVEHTGGDAMISGLSGSVEIAHVGGNLTLQGAGKLDVGHIGGDMAVTDVRESLSIRRVGGNLTGEILGSVSVEMVGGDCEMIASDGIRLRCGGDIRVSVDASSKDEVVLKAGGDVNVHLPENINARLDLISGGRDVTVNLGGSEKNYEDENTILTLGKGERAVRVKAGGDIEITDFPMDVSDIKEKFHDLNMDWDKSTRHAGHAEHWGDFEERIQKRAEDAARRAEERVKAAMERVERESRFGEYASGKFDKFLGFFGVGQSFGGHPEPPVPPDPAMEAQPSAPAAEVNSATFGGSSAASVTNEERMLVLKMLQENKITVEEAEQLLASLEGLFD